LWLVRVNWVPLFYAGCKAGSDSETRLTRLGFGLRSAQIEFKGLLKLILGAVDSPRSANAYFFKKLV
jgi:hypothetical protein